MNYLNSKHSFLYCEYNNMYIDYYQHTDYDKVAEEAFFNILNSVNINFMDDKAFEFKIFGKHNNILKVVIYNGKIFETKILYDVEIEDKYTKINKLDEILFKQKSSIRVDNKNLFYKLKIKKINEFTFTNYDNNDINLYDNHDIYDNFDIVSYIIDNKYKQI